MHQENGTFYANVKTAKGFRWDSSLMGQADATVMDETILEEPFTLLCPMRVKSVIDQSDVICKIVFLRFSFS